MPRANGLMEWIHRDSKTPSPSVRVTVSAKGRRQPPQMGVQSRGFVYEQSSHLKRFSFIPFGPPWPPTSSIPQETLALGSEDDWVSEGLYEGSSKAGSEMPPEEDFPSEVH